MKSNHQVKVVRINEILPHTNADTLGIVQIGGYQCVVKKDNYQIGSLAIYVQPDSVVPERPEFEFLWKPRSFDGSVPEKYRRVTVRRFRGEWSEGLLLPVSDFPELAGAQEGDNVAEVLGVTHYEPPEPGQPTVSRKQQYHWPPKSLKGWFYYLLHLIGIDLNGPTGGDNEKGPKDPPPVYDIEAYKNYLGSFAQDEEVLIHEKIHGSNARFVFHNKRFYCGSRKLWKSPKSSCVWRKAAKQNPWIEEWCREHPGFVLYGEVVPTQLGYNYGALEGEVKLFLFDVLKPNGEWATVEEIETM